MLSLALSFLFDFQGTYVEGIKEHVVLSSAHCLSLIAAGEGSGYFEADCSIVLYDLSSLYRLDQFIGMLCFYLMESKG
jgi:hypothetical protein